MLFMGLIYKKTVSNKLKSFPMSSPRAPLQDPHIVSHAEQTWSMAPFSKFLQMTFFLKNSHIFSANGYLGKIIAAWICHICTDKLF